ncbi:gluconate 5-dehydrogenase [Propionibacterium cyclohexanicum]|uniref:Gluconate 5-dehydrogenase n=1 Tax=Propionibacterium cyclohexanicum TaxID=64702 RepID=A0A1H9T7H2_9ACTN|nr:glucose 1-dehydrogenase [Propionibacterium cyclohexanicum]SER93185.1 gluconate 5-dehydrogenase [Propionibacterium cyclohexanicum]
MTSAERYFDITGRKALVTGSSRGIGYSLARGLAQAGVELAVHGRHAEGARAAAQRLAQETGAQVHAVSFDVTDPDSVAEGVAQTVEDLGGLDILVNNAGIQRRHAFTEFPVDEWNEVIATNLSSAFLVSQQAAKVFVAQRRGKIINIGSVQSQLARPSITPYSASKGGIVMLTKGLCADLGPQGVQANALAPGYFKTELTKTLVEDEQFTAWVTGRTPAARWGDVDDLVGTLLFLASPASDFVNGQTIYVDGGMTAVV